MTLRVNTRITTYPEDVLEINTLLDGHPVDEILLNTLIDNFPTTVIPLKVLFDAASEGFFLVDENGNPILTDEGEKIILNP